MKLGARLFIPVVAAFSPMSAKAIGVGQCGSPADISAKLKLEGQSSIITGDRLIPTRDINPAQVFTTNSDGMGYLIEGDEPNIRPSSKFCVVLQYKEAKLFDSRKSSVPMSALYKGRHNEVLRSANRSGIRVLLQARTLHNGQTSSIMTIDADETDRVGGMMFTDHDGNVKMMANFEHVQYTAKAIRMLSEVAP